MNKGAIDCSEDGTLTWTCPHCNKKNSAHVSHESVQYSRVDEKMVDMPACACGATTSARVVFHEAETAAPDMQHNADGSIARVTYDPEVSHWRHDEHYASVGTAADGTPLLTRVIDRVYLNPAIEHHQRLHELCKAHGKVYTPLDQTPQEQGDIAQT